MLVIDFCAFLLELRIFFPYSTRCSGLYVVRLYSYALKRAGGSRTFLFLWDTTR